MAPMSFLSVWSCLVGSSGPFLALLMHYGPCWSIDSLFFRLRSGLGVECIIFLLSFFVVHFPDITFSLFNPPVHGRPLLIFSLLHLSLSYPGSHVLDKTKSGELEDMAALDSVRKAFSFGFRSTSTWVLIVD